MGKNILCFLVCLAGLSAFLPSSLGAENRSDKGFVLKRHEVAVSTGILPGRYANGGYDYYEARFEDNSWTSKYDKAKYREQDYMAGVWSLSYTYNFTKLLALQANVFYESAWIKYTKINGNVPAGTIRDTYITTMAAFKVNWFNRPWVRMYSSVGLGTSYNITSNDDIDRPGSAVPQSDILVACQLTPFGLTVGKAFYGIFEIGFGHFYSGISVGAGYRF